MEDNSYVNLSLQKYNELYDKAKKYDELTNELGDKITECITTIFDNFSSNKEIEQPKEYNSDTVHVGDKVLIKHDLNKIDNFRCGYMPNMKNFEGKVVTVSNVDYYYFNFKEDEVHDYNYDYRAIEKIISRNKEEN